MSWSYSTNSFQTQPDPLPMSRCTAPPPSTMRLLHSVEKEEEPKDGLTNSLETSCRHGNKASHIYASVKMGFSVTNKPPSNCRHMCTEVVGEHERVLSYVKLRTSHINYFSFMNLDWRWPCSLELFFFQKKMLLQFLCARITCRELAKRTGDSPPQAKQISLITSQLSASTEEQKKFHFDSSILKFS